MQEFADLHIHSSHSKATSQSITPSSLLAASAKKGISVLGSGDALVAGWRSAWSESTENDEGILIVPSAEGEGDDRIHHLILMEDFERFEELADAFRKSSTDIDTGGRPHVKLSGAEIAARVYALGGLVRPGTRLHPLDLPLRRVRSRPRLLRQRADRLPRARSLLRYLVRHRDPRSA